jgi:glycosyltransferase involved in cell wall biosynthesis
VPGDLATPTGGYVYDRKIIAGLRRLGWDVTVVDLGDGFPHAGRVAEQEAQRRLAALPPERPIVIDGLAFGVLPEAARALGASHRLIALVHHPLAYESGLSADEADRLRRSERAALAHAHSVIATSAYTARLIADEYAVPRERITVVMPGTERAPRARGSGSAEAALLAVGAVVPRKGYDVLIPALAELVPLQWRLTIAGDSGRDAEAAARLEADLVRFGLTDRVAVAGALSAERLAALYDAADLFVLASRFEGYGMAYTEAIARGLPVIGTTAGAIPETVPPDAGILVPPGDVPALAAALRRLIESPAERKRLAARAWAAAASLPTWEEAASAFARAVAVVA